MLLFLYVLIHTSCITMLRYTVAHDTTYIGNEDSSLGDGDQNNKRVEVEAVL